MEHKLQSNEVGFVNNKDGLVKLNAFAQPRSHFCYRTKKFCFVIFFVRPLCGADHLDKKCGHSMEIELEPRFFEPPLDFTPSSSSCLSNFFTFRYLYVAYVSYKINPLLSIRYILFPSYYNIYGTIIANKYLFHSPPLPRSIFVCEPCLE